jgi:hypothetical protein
VARVAASGGTAADVYWSDGSDRVLFRSAAGVSTTDGSATDGRLLLLRQVYGTPTAWLAAEATRAATVAGGLLDTGGLRASVAWDGSALEVQTSETPAPRQIVAYAPSLFDARLNGVSVSYLRAGSYVLLPSDCATEERCNRLDDDCDGEIDEDDAVDAPSWYRDEDGDDFGTASDTVQACVKPSGYAAEAGDCNDEDRASHPGAPENCWGMTDDDCDGTLDEQEPSCEQVLAPEDNTLFTCTLGGQAGRPASPAMLGVAFGLLFAAGGVRRARRRRLSGETAPVVLAGLTLLAGCSSPEAQTYAVTLLDSDVLECTGSAQGLLADPVALAELADELRKAWKKDHEAAPARPVPRQLQVNELGDRMQAWFGGESSSTTLGDAGAADDLLDGGLGEEGVAALSAAFGFDAPEAVYQGELRDGYVEGSYVSSIDTDQQDEEEGRLLCGPRARAEGTLTVTKVDGVQGRIRWVHTAWVSSDFSACEGRVDCARNIAVEGLAVP